MSNCPHCGEATWTEGKGCEHGCDDVAELKADVKRQAARIAHLEARIAAADALAEAVNHEQNMVCQDMGKQLDASLAVDEALAAYENSKEQG